MSDGPTHRRVGAMAGLAAGAYSVCGLPPDAAIARIVGSTVGGVVGGALPDAIEPGVHSWHRKFFHSQTALLGASAAAARPPEWLRDWTGSLSREAHVLRTRRETMPAGDRDRTGLWLREMLIQALLGLLLGLVVGYVSHLVLDARSPRRLPLI